MGEEAEDLVTVRTCHDSNEAAMLKAVLEEEGFVVATPGLEHRSMLGMAGSFVKIPLKVPRRDLDDARALLDALSAQQETDDDEDGEGRESLVGEAPRQRRVAIFVACVLTFGAGHFYVRETAAGLTLLVLEVAAIITLCAGVPLAGVVIFGCVLADIMGSFRAIHRLEEGESKLSRLAQVARTLPIVAVGSVVFAGVLQILPEEVDPLYDEPMLRDPFPYEEPAPYPEDPFRERGEGEPGDPYGPMPDFEP